MEAKDWLFLALAIFAILLSFGIERLKRPRVEIAARQWTPSVPVPWSFAVVSVRNKPLARPWSWFFVRGFAASGTAHLRQRLVPRRDPLAERSRTFRSSRRNFQRFSGAPDERDGSAALSAFQACAGES